MQEQVFIDKAKQYLKGNLHTHTNLSDGKYPVSEVLKIYSENKYDFIGITDHDLFYEGENTSGEMLIIAGQEVTCDYIGDPECKGAYVHFSCFQKKAVPIAPMTYKNAEELQKCIEELKKNYRLVQFNHPLFSSMFAKLSENDVVSLNDYDLLEIYNHKDFRNETGISSAEVLVRCVLNARKKLLLTAGDDFHGPYKKAKNDYFGGGYIMVNAEKNEESILAAIENGDFYSTTGPRIIDYRRIGNRLEITTSPVKNIIFYSNVRRCKNILSDDGEDITFGEYEIRDADYYVWVKIVDTDGKTAWTQPLYL
ncbi:MAG: CehA/McbA family metallohydrolase [Clostridia bacterium]|nr:CehA/McbA family metallohydrolase [Clostridia bacterium]